MSRKRFQKPRKSGRKLAIILTLLVGWIVCGIGWVWFRSNQSASEQSGKSQFQLTDTAKTYSAYGGSGSCRECHEEAFADWAKSHHALAERAPDARDAIAFTPPRTLQHETQQTALREAHGQFEIVSAGLHGSNEVFHVERILAENPLRQMLIPFPGGRLQATEAAFDPRSNQWFNVYGIEDRKPGEWGHWTGRGMNWNSMCATCHNTRVRKNYDSASDNYQTAMVENGVGCESCHGPLKAHNQWQALNKNKGLKDPTLKKLTRDQTFDTCAACHSRRAEITGDPQPGESFFDHHMLSVVDDSNLFYPDGQIRDEDYEVTAFMGSRMYNKGVRCLDCHNPHTMKTKLPGNFLCMSCHAPGASTNAPAIDPVGHSHHRVFGYNTNGVLVNADLTTYIPDKIKETGGECVNCHMPQTVYMQRHSRHDHGFTIPDPLLTQQFDIPNACNRCHLDKSTGWSLEFVDKWYGDKMNRPYRQRAQTIARARQGDPDAREPLIKMLETDDSPYWQAVAANLLGRWAGESKTTAALLKQLQHTNALVRQFAVQSLGPLATTDHADITAALYTLLRDPSRNVRMEAARQLTVTLDTNSLAGSEYLHFLNHVSDQPLGQLQAGEFEMRRGDLTNALPHFQKAAEWDQFSGGIRHELAIVLSQLGRSEDALKQLEAAVRLEPNVAEFHYKLALALNEAGDSRRVTAELERAVQCDPRHARAWYNLGLARSGSGDAAGAIDALQRAESVDPTDAAIPYARATVLARLGRRTEARIAAQRALALNPNFSDAAVLLQRLGQ